MSKLDPGGDGVVASRGNNEPVDDIIRVQGSFLYPDDVTDWVCGRELDGRKTGKNVTGKRVFTSASVRADMMMMSIM